MSELFALPDLPERSAFVQLPASLRAVIRERLGSLDPAQLEALTAAAVVGRDFTLPLAAEVADAPPPELEAAVHEACRLGVLQLREPGHYRFSHGLVAETLVLDLKPASRALLHRRAAEALERRYVGSPAAPLNEMARHWLEAGVDAAPRAVQAAERAARQAMLRLAFADAASMYERALAAGAFDLSRRRCSAGGALRVARRGAGPSGSAASRRSGVRDRGRARSGAG